MSLFQVRKVFFSSTLSSNEDQACNVYFWPLLITKMKKKQRNKEEINENIFQKPLKQSCLTLSYHMSRGVNLKCEKWEKWWFIVTSKGPPINNITPIFKLFDPCPFLFTSIKYALGMLSNCHYNHTISLPLLGELIYEWTLRVSFYCLLVGHSTLFCEFKSRKCLF